MTYAVMLLALAYAHPGPHHEDERQLPRQQESEVDQELEDEVDVKLAGHCLVGRRVDRLAICPSVQLNTICYEETDGRV